MSLAIRSARPDDYETLCALFDELDEFHRRGRPDFFRPFDGPPRTREQVERWCSGPGSTVLVAEDDGEVVGLAVLLRRVPSGFAGAVPREVIELDNLVVRCDWRGREVGGTCSTPFWTGHARRGRAMSRWRFMPSIETRGAFTSASVLRRRSTGWCWRLETGRFSRRERAGCRSNNVIWSFLLHTQCRTYVQE